MLGLYKRWNRRRLIEQPLPVHWRSILETNAVFLPLLAESQRIRVLDSIKVLVAEKHWEGCDGLKLTDEHRVTLAAQIARISIGFDQPDYFDEVRSILVYPDVYVAQGQVQLGSGVTLHEPSTRLGEAWYRGPVVLAWADSLASGRGHNPPRNVVIHEFTHHLDMRNSREPDGVPPIEDAVQANEWVAALDAAHRALVECCRVGQPSILDCYGATSRSEFFAVASEAYFEAPEALAAEFPVFFQQMNRYFRPNLAC